MKLAEKIRYLREVEGSLRGLDRAMTQQELVRAIEAETGGRTISQSYLSQLESGARPHLTNTTRLLLAKFFKVHPGYLVEDPEDFQSELRTGSAHEDDQLDLWLVAGAERFGRRDRDLCRALLAIAHHEDSRGCLLLLESILKTPQLAARLDAALNPERNPEADRPNGPQAVHLEEQAPAKAKLQPAKVTTKLSRGRKAIR